MHSAHAPVREISAAAQPKIGEIYTRDDVVVDSNIRFASRQRLKAANSLEAIYARYPEEDIPLALTEVLQAVIAANRRRVVPHLSHATFPKLIFGHVT